LNDVRDFFFDFAVEDVDFEVKERRLGEELDEINLIFVAPAPPFILFTVDFASCAALNRKVLHNDVCNDVFGLNRHAADTNVTPPRAAPFHNRNMIETEVRMHYLSTHSIPGLTFCARAPPPKVFCTFKIITGLILYNIGQNICTLKSSRNAV
jgi:hypothetical protein